jgi:hypothetical protein
MSTEYTITYPTIHPDFSIPSFVPFGFASNGKYSDGYKMVAFEPGKILQAEELNEIQFRMNVHQTLTLKMISNWMSTIVFSGTEDSSGPGWDGATPLNPNMITVSTDAIGFATKNWYLCKAASSGLFFWLYFQTSGNISTILTLLSSIPENSYIGFELNTSGTGEYTGEIVDCNTTGSLGTHDLRITSTSICGSSRYYLKIVGIKITDDLTTAANVNSFVPIAQKRADGMYFLNNIKIESVV